MSAAPRHRPDGIVSARERAAAGADTPARLHDFQRVMFRAVTRPLDGDESATRWDDGRDADTLLAAFVKGDRDRSALHRVRTYNRMYWYRTLDSLAEDFPGAQAILGERFFPCAVAYLENHPSTSFTLRHLGRKFPDWLRARARQDRDIAFRAAADCAAVEWALCHAFEAGDGDSALPESGGDLNRLRLALRPHVTLLTTAWGIPAFLEKVARNESPGDTGANAAHLPDGAEAGESPALMPRRSRTCVVVYRSPAFALKAEKMAPAPFRLLSLLATGVPLGLALARMDAQGRAPTPDKIRQWFHDWSSKGLLMPLDSRSRPRTAHS